VGSPAPGGKRHPATIAELRHLRNTRYHDKPVSLYGGMVVRELDKLIDLRNPAAHSGATDRKAVMQRREEILGIGCEGLLPKLLRVKARGG
jgi:hypothetical protein